VRGKKPEESEEKINDDGKRCGKAKERQVLYFFGAHHGGYKAKQHPHGRNDIQEKNGAAENFANKIC
jgi:hypothetical protein